MGAKTAASLLVDEMFSKIKMRNNMASKENFDTIIGASTEFYGRLVLLDSARIDGKVTGNIESADGRMITVAIGPSGRVFGDIVCPAIPCNKDGS